MNREGRLNIVSMFSFLETDTREQKKYEKRIQSSVDNTVNDLRYKIKFRAIDKNIFYSWRHIFFKILRNLIASTFFFFFDEADT